MSESLQAIFADARVLHHAPAAAGRYTSTTARLVVDLAIYDDLDGVEADWRRFERSADSTVFQAFDWLSLWHRHFGRRQDARPAIVVGRRADGEPLFLIPLAVVPGIARRLIFLGCDLCDYNAPLLAREFSGQVAPGQFQDLWREICRLLQLRPQHRHDIIELTKMPETIGAQANPFVGLDVELNPSHAHLAQLSGSWDEFYRAKRSSETRRRDRTKLKRLSEFGDVRMVTPDQLDDIARTLQVLVEQKTKQFARMGVANIFARPGCLEFFFDLATNPRTRSLVHVSRLEVGPIWAAVNLGLTDRDCYYHVLASYGESEVSRFGPGAAHLRDLMSRAIERGFRKFDFTIGDERYKSEWADTTLNLYDHVIGVTARGWPLATLARTRRQLKRTIKQNPVLWDAFSRMRAAARSAMPGRTAAAGAHPTEAPPARHPEREVEPKR
jgi:CelD/BcsL family acetyltransferase involved in cellulose biosynthesis